MLSNENGEIKGPQSEIVKEMVRLGLGEPATKITLVMDQGNVNRAYDITTQSGNFILRVRFDSDKIGQFTSEKRCADLIREKYDWTPEIIAVGKYEGHSYSVQNKVQGIIASRYQGDLISIWEQIGQYADLFHQMKTPGYIYDLFAEGSDADKPWCQWYFDYLGKAENSKIVAGGYLSRAEFEAALNAIAPMKSLVFDPTLAHGNLSLKNTIVDASGHAHIVDWGTCQGHMSIELDIADLLASGVSKVHVQAYLRGHNLPPDYIEQNEILIERLLLIRVFTAARWFCDITSNRKDYMQNFLKKIRESTQRLRPYISIQ